MGYYDFNDHFWSPLEVCAQAPKKEPLKKNLNIINLLNSIFSAEYNSSKTLVKKANSIIH